MNLSGILVMAKPVHLDSVVQSLEALGVEVFHRDDCEGRLIAVQEAADIHAEIDGVKTIKAVPHVIMAEMVYHYFADDAREYDAIPEELAEVDSPVCVPDYLNA